MKSVAVFIGALSLVSGACFASAPTVHLQTVSDARGEINFEHVKWATRSKEGLRGNDESAEVPLAVNFSLTNRTDHTLDRPEIALILEDHDGNLRGYFGTTLQAVAAGQTARFLIRTDDLMARAGDRVLLAPATAVEAQSGAAAAFQRTMEKMSAEQCDLMCESKEAACEARCPSGIGAFSCGCQGTGGYTYSCSCMVKPAK